MRRKPETRTGRGLRWALYGEILLTLAALSYVAFRPSLRLFSFWFGLALFVGVLSLIRIWQGREEFGPEQERMAKRGLFVTLASGSLLAATFLSLQTFTSPTHELDVFIPGEAEPSPNAHRFDDLKPPVFFLAAAFATETIGGALMLWELVGVAWRRVTWLYGSLGAVGAIIVARRGLEAIAGFQATLGPRADSLAQAQQYYRRFLDEWLPFVMLVIVATRIVAFVLVRHALRKIAEAEADYRTQAATEPVPSP